VSVDSENTGQDSPDSKDDVAKGPSVLIIGAGIAGIEAALNLAEYGCQVHLVEEGPSIGGLMARLDKTFPTNDCSICIEAPKMYEVQKHPNIEMHTYTTVRRARFKDGLFKVRLNKRQRWVDEELCKGCGKCEEACPVEVPDELDGKIGGMRKLIYAPFPQAVPNVWVVDDDCRFCRMRDKGACIGDCIVDCSQCRECQIAKCVVACRKEGAEALLLWQRAKSFDVSVDSIIIATGIRAFVPPEGMLGYDIFDNVITGLQFERLMNAGGPTEGEIVRPSDRKHAKSVAWVQCLGRGRTDVVPYCSKVCCMAATKQAIVAKEHDQEMETTIFFRDLKTYGKGFHEFVERAKAQGTDYIKANPADVWEDPDTGKLVVRYEDAENSGSKQIEVDILVLSIPLLAPEGNKKLAKALKIKLDDFGFFEEADPIKMPLETDVKGIYLAGSANGPCDIADSVTKAIAASLKAVLPRG
jgi:heterodisulfide reductase subunit A